MNWSGRLSLLLTFATRVDATALHAAAQRGDDASLRDLLTTQPDVDQTDQRQLTALHVACLRGQAAAAQVLLQHRANPNAVDSRGMRPLHLAALGANADIVRALLQHGASINERESSQQSTALHIAATNPRGCDVAAVLLESGAALAKDGQGQTAAELASAMASPCVELFSRKSQRQQDARVQVTVEAEGPVRRVSPSRSALKEPEAQPTSRTHAEKTRPTTSICLYQFDDRSDDALGSMVHLTRRNEALCEADTACTRYTFERAGVGLPPWWSKVHLMREHMKNRPDCAVVAWVDTDAVLNGAPSTVLAELGSYHMLVSRDLPIWGEDDETLFNAGVWAVRNSAEGVRLMDTWYRLYPADAWTRVNGSWLCFVEPEEPGSAPQPCEWSKEMFEQGAFTKHVLPLHSDQIRHSSWAVLNSPCVTADDIQKATACHFADELKPLIPYYLDGVDMVRDGLLQPSGRVALWKGLEAAGIEPLRRMLSALAAWKETFGVPTVDDKGAKPSSGTGSEQRRAIGSSPAAAPVCLGREDEMCTPGVDLGRCGDVCEQHRRRECGAVIGRHNVPDHELFPVEATLPRLSFLTIEPRTPPAVLARHGFDVVHRLGKDDSGYYTLSHSHSLSHVGKHDADRCARSPRSIQLTPSDITIVRVRNATATFEGFVYTSSGTVLSVEPRYTLTLLAELLRVPAAYRLSRRCGSSTDGSVAACCIAARSEAAARLSLRPLLFGRAEGAARVGAHNSAFYDELQFFEPQLQQCAGASNTAGSDLRADEPPSTVFLEEVLVWQPMYSNNFYHFINNGLPRLLRLLPWLTEHPSVRLFFAGEQPFSRSVLDALGLSGRQVPFSPCSGVLLELLPGRFGMPNDLQDDELSTQCAFTPYWYLTALRRLRYHAILLHDFGWDDAHYVPVEPLAHAVQTFIVEGQRTIEPPPRAERRPEGVREPQGKDAAVRHSAGHATGDISLEGCPEHVSWKDAPFPNSLQPDEPSFVYWLRSLFTPKEAAVLVRLLMPAAFNTDADSTDHLPSYEVYLLGAGKAADAAPQDAARLAKARSLVLPRIEQCVTPFLQRKFECEACMPCVSLVRRYKPRERTFVRPHRDALARVTMVVELQPGDGSSPAAAAAAGGLFIQKSEAAEPSMVPMRAGDAFLHDYHLLHGVKLACEGCTRYSLVVWFREDAARCSAGGDVEAATQMYRRSALAGIAEGRYSWARHAIQVAFDGRYEVRPNALPKNASDAERAGVVHEALALLEDAALQQGHGDSAVFLAELHLEGVPGALEPDAQSTEKWRQRAREMGSSELAAWEATRGEKLRALRNPTVW